MENNTNVMLPLVHLNGTSRDALVEMYDKADRALRDALYALDDASPNARDYYPYGDKSFKDAADQHIDRIRRVKSVIDEISFIADAIREE